MDPVTELARESEGRCTMSVRERIAAIRLVEKLAKNKAYAEKIGVVAGQGKGVESREWERKGK